MRIFAAINRRLIDDKWAWIISLILIIGIVVINIFLMTNALNSNFGVISEDQARKAVKDSIIIFLMPPISDVSYWFDAYISIAMIICAIIFRWVSKFKWSFSHWGKFLRYVLIFCTVGTAMQFCLIADDSGDFEYYLALLMVFMVMYGEKT